MAKERNEIGNPLPEETMLHDPNEEHKILNHDQMAKERNEIRNPLPEDTMLPDQKEEMKKIMK
jgi:hypothetical protein